MVVALLGMGEMAVLANVVPGPRWLLGMSAGGLGAGPGFANWAVKWVLEYIRKRY